jgi:hypothetical protein
VDGLEAERARMKRALDDGRDAGAMAEAREVLPKVEAALARARAALEELERLAAAKGVPLEWRR